MNRTLKPNISRYWLHVSALLFIMIVILSLWPQSQLPKVAGTDKLHHFIAYLILALPVTLKKPRMWLTVLVFFMICSGLIELIQPFVNRYGEWRDFLSNIFGIGCGAALGSVVRSTLLSPARIK